MNYRIYQNGKEIQDTQTIDLLRDEAISIFESMRAYNGRIFLQEEHLARLFDSARTVGYKPLPGLKKLQQELKIAMDLSGEKNTSVRLTLAGGRIFVMIGAREVARPLYKKGVVLKTASFPRGSGSAFPYQAKTSAYQQAVFASTEPGPAGAFDWLFLDQGNYLTETRTGNFFLVKYPLQDPVLENSKTGSYSGG